MKESQVLELDGQEVVTTDVLADMLGMARSSVNHMCRIGKLYQAKRYGHVWLVPVPVKMRPHGKSGRPRHGEPRVSVTYVEAGD